MARKGAKNIQNIPKEVLSSLNKGEIETVNLVEWLAIDHLKLIKNVFPKIGICQSTIKAISNTISPEKTNIQTTKQIANLLYKSEKPSVIKSLNAQKSDAIRCYVPFIIGANDELTLNEKLTQLKPSILDGHFMVREMAWLGIRQDIDKHLNQAFAIFDKWTNDENENIRRFISEATRPRGVWCCHIDELKKNPEMALSILNNLKSDESPYVQKSVGNWLNDASKSKPCFVKTLCDDWLKTSKTKATQTIVKRALRTIDKNVD